MVVLRKVATRTSVAIVLGLVVVAAGGFYLYGRTVNRPGGRSDSSIAAQADETYRQMDIEPTVASDVPIDLQTSETYHQAGIEGSPVFPRGTPEKLDYFPERLGCGWRPFRWLPPPDSVLAQATSQPPVPLFAESFEAVATSAIAPKWLPDRFNDALYLEKGEGAYRAQTAHLCKVYDREGAHVVLKGFVGMLIVMIRPAPVELGPEVQAILQEATDLPDEPYDPDDTDPAIYPYSDSEDGAPACIDPLFAPIRDAVLTPAAQPRSEKDWQRRIKHMRMIYGGVGITYPTKGPIHDPGLGVPGKVHHEVSLWTNGRVLILRVYSALPDADRTELYRALQPTLEVPTEGSLPGHIAKVTTRNEWTDAEGCLVPTQQQATHQRFYLLNESGTGHSARIEIGGKSEQLEIAAWFTMADIAISRIANHHYAFRQIKGRIKNAESRSKALEWVKERRDRCLAALRRLEESTCPRTLEPTREKVLSLLQVAEDIWDIAWTHWQSALQQPEDAAVDYDDVVATIEEEIAEKDLPSLAWGFAFDAIKEAQQELGIEVMEWW